MRRSYAVKWREPDGRVYLGRLELAPQGLLLEGRYNGRPAVRRSVGYEEMSGVRIGRGAEERFGGRPALVVERPGGDLFVTSTVVHAGVLPELVERLAAKREGAGP